MKSKSLLFIIALPLLAAGCAFQQKSPGATYDRIGQEMQNAVDAKPKGTEDALRQAMMPPAQVELPQAAKIVEPRFDLAVNEAPARSVFLALVSGTRYSMLLPPDVSGSEADRPKISINLKNVTVHEALESLRELYGYEFKIQKTRIYIQPNILKTHLFRVNYLAGTRGGQSDIRVSSGQAADSAGSSGSSSSGSTSGSTSGSGAFSGATSQISTSSSQTGFWADLESALKSIVGLDAPAASAAKGAPAVGAAVPSQAKEGRNIIINQASGVILVKGYPADIRAVEEYLKKTQLIVERQVMIEAKIMQVELNQDFQAGINWNFLRKYSDGSLNIGSGMAQTPGSSSSSLTPNASALDYISGSPNYPIGSAAGTAVGGGLFGLGLVIDQFSAMMKFLETQGNVQVLSSPRIATTNNQKAVLKVGTDDYFITEITSSNNNNTGAAGTTTGPSMPTIKVTPFFSGVSLDVTPQIDEENNITLHVHPLVSSVVDKTKVVNLGDTFGTFQLPFASSTTSETDSVVRVQDGNIVVIGGLMKYDQANNADGLPGTTTSALGMLFGSRANHLRKSELVIMIKPTIIRDESSLKEDLYETQSRLKELDPRQSRQYPAP